MNTQNQTARPSAPRTGWAQMPNADSTMRPTRDLEVVP